MANVVIKVESMNMVEKGFEESTAEDCPGSKTT